MYGAGVTVRLGGDADALTVRGERNQVETQRVGSLVVEGRTNRVAAAGEVVSAAVRGDGNTVDASDRVGSLVVAGNDNTVTATGVGSIDVSGDRNTVPGR
ncbi:hypothetical protein GCM10010462_06980 [Microbacterium dextranolyticum]|uniref:DUF3060 domain-containing protein n=1 Tax=Microbacterium dextranolyticum TaxID=36806 RepID=A0A9W6HNI4_9MICO|nr:hypothetical protein GCM10017591_21650 [Microbacterium dextranolyticum]